MIVGGSMLIVGWLVLLGTVIEVIPSHVALNLAAYCLTLVGFMIGVVGALAKIRANRSKDEF